MDEEILQLREENATLKNIIASLAGKIMRIEKVLYSNDENRDGENQMIYSDDKNQELIKSKLTPIKKIRMA